MSDPERIKDILPAVLANIKQRMDAATQERRVRIRAAVGDYLSGTGRRGKSGRTRPCPAEGLFADTNQNTGASDV